MRELAPHLLAQKGIGVLIAAKLIGEIGGIDRFQTDAQLARLAGCASIPVSSGPTDRYRLDRGGNRQLNHAFHMLALTRINHDPQTARYMAKQRATGKTNPEAIRCLKRHLVRRVYHLHDPTAVPTTIRYAGLDITVHQSDQRRAPGRRAIAGHVDTTTSALSPRRTSPDHASGATAPASRSLANYSNAAFTPCANSARRHSSRHDDQLVRAALTHTDAPRPAPCRLLPPRPRGRPS